jgi:hypothetical protein
MSSWAMIPTMNLMDLFQFYLVVVFILSIVLRRRQYRGLVELVAAGPQRWPRLINLLREERWLLLSWPTLVPIALALLLMLIHSAMYNLVWPHAAVTFSDLTRHTTALGLLLIWAATMLTVDAQATFSHWEFNKADYEPMLDQAEYWLTTRWAPALKVLTFGRVDPEQRVRAEVRQALLRSQADIRSMFWNWSIQVGFRLAFGITLWLTWALLLRP